MITFWLYSKERPKGRLFEADSFEQRDVFINRMVERGWVDSPDKLRDGNMKPAIDPQSIRENLEAAKREAQDQSGVRRIENARTQAEKDLESGIREPESLSKQTAIAAEEQADAQSDIASQSPHEDAVHVTVADPDPNDDGIKEVDPAAVAAGAAGEGDESGEDESAQQTTGTANDPWKGFDL